MYALYFRKCIILLLSVIILSSCGRYIVGSINIRHNYSGPDALSYFNYRVLGKKVTAEARIGGVKYNGEIVAIRHSVGKRKRINNFSLLRMRSEEGSLVECYITQRSKKNFAKGGSGTCFGAGVKLYDIVVQSSKVYVSSGILRSFTK